MHLANKRAECGYFNLTIVLQPVEINVFFGCVENGAKKVISSS